MKDTAEQTGHRAKPYNAEQRKKEHAQEKRGRKTMGGMEERPQGRSKAPRRTGGKTAEETRIASAGREKDTRGT